MNKDTSRTSRLPRLEFSMSENTPLPDQFEFVNDGTLDTVIRCKRCSCEARYNYNGEMTYEEFCTWVVNDYADEHDCSIFSQI